MEWGANICGEAGVEVILDSARLAVVGITEVLGHFRALLKAYIELKSFIKKKWDNSFNFN